MCFRKITIGLIALLILGVSSLAVLAQTSVDLTMPIPGFMDEATGLADRITLCAEDKVSGVIKCDGIARYIVALYKWLIALTVILAVIALMAGGAIWLMAGGSEKRVTQAHGVIKNSLVGLFIALFSYLGLWLISPNLVQFKPLRVFIVQKILLEFQEAENSVGTSTGECPTASPQEVLSLIDQNKIKINADVSYGVSIKEQITKGNIDPQILGAIKLVYEICPESPYISSLMREKSQNHINGKAVDFAGDICGGSTEKMCSDEKTKKLVKALRDSGYHVGTWLETCFGSFKESPEGTRATGPHLHIQSRNACVGGSSEEYERDSSITDAGGGIVPPNCAQQTSAPCDNPTANNLVQIPSIPGISLTGGAALSGRGYLHRDVIEQLKKVAAKAKAQGYELSIFSACRPWSHQKDLYDSRPIDPKTGKKKETVAKPGCSNHQYGRALDVHLVDKNGGNNISTTPIGDSSAIQCSINTNVLQGLKKLNELMYSEDFMRLTFESWHYEYAPGGASAPCRSTSCTGYASMCGKTGADDCKKGANGCGK